MCGQLELPWWELRLCKVLPWVLWKFFLCYQEGEWERKKVVVGLGLQGLTGLLSAMQCTR